MITISKKEPKAIFELANMLKEADIPFDFDFQESTIEFVNRKKRIEFVNRKKRDIGTLQIEIYGFSFLGYGVDLVKLNTYYILNLNSGRESIHNEVDIYTAEEAFRRISDIYGRKE